MKPGISDAQVLAGIRAGRPVGGPQAIHIDVTNGCNAACVTCWDHSPLLQTPRSAEWKRRRMPIGDFRALIAQAAALGSVRSVVLSGMGEPLTHPDIYEMVGAVCAEGWALTLMTNLVAAEAADMDRLCREPIARVLVGVQGAGPDSYMGFHPGWTERHWAALCRNLRRLQRAGIPARHVQVIDRNTAPDLVEMIRFGHTFGADRVTFKLASLAAGTEATAVTPDQRRWLLEAAVPEAEALAARLGQPHNLPLFLTQLRAAPQGDDPQGALSSGSSATVPIADIGCYMGYAYTRITVDQEVLYCCNTEVRVGRLAEATLQELWQGERWQRLRDQLQAGRFFNGCDRCGKVEQNMAWARALRAGA